MSALNAVSARFFQDVRYLRMRNVFAETHFYNFVRQQSQTPPAIALRGVAARQRRDLRPLFSCESGGRPDRGWSSNIFNPSA